MILQRTAIAAARPAIVQTIVKRSFTSTLLRSKEAPPNNTTGKDVPPPAISNQQKIKRFEEIKTDTDLLAPGAKPGSVPTDIEQATGLERLEILGKMEGVDIFDMKPLDASRLGTMDNPIVVKSAGDEQYCGCTGFPADSHTTIWLTLSRNRPIERCPECGNVLKMEYVGPQYDLHAHGHEEHGHGHGDESHNYEEPKTFADFIPAEARYQ